MDLMERLDAVLGNQHRQDQQRQQRQQRPQRGHIAGMIIEPTLGDGSDGDLRVRNRVVLAPDQLHQYRSVTVQRGGVLTTRGWDGNAGGVLHLRVQGELVVEEGGTIDVSGLGYRGGLAHHHNAGHLNSAQGESEEGEGGNRAENNGGGGGGGFSGDNWGSAGGGGGGYGTAGEAVRGRFVGGRGGAALGSADLGGRLRLGSGGGGGRLMQRARVAPWGGGLMQNPNGGNGGGAIDIVARSITIHGVVSASGADAAVGHARVRGASGGGGGSGGTVLLRASTIIMLGQVTCIGGAGGECCPQQGLASTGGRGGDGRIRVDVDNLRPRGALDPARGAWIPAIGHQGPSPQFEPQEVRALREAVEARDAAQLRAALLNVGAVANLGAEVVLEVAAARTLAQSLEEGARLTQALTHAIAQRDYRQIREALDAARALDQYPLPGPLLARAQRVLDDVHVRVREWFAKRLGNDLALPHLPAFEDRELQALVGALDRAEVATICTCANERHEPMRAVVGEMTAGRDVLQQTADAAAAVLALKVEITQALNDETPQKEAERDAARRVLGEANERELATRAAHQHALELQRAAVEADATATAVLETHMTACDEAATDLDGHRIRHGHFTAVHELVRDAHALKSTQLRGAEDRIGAPNALATFTSADVNHLLIELGVCCYIEPFAQHGVGPQQLVQSEAALQRIVADSDMASFGDVRRFKKALERIERGDGLPPEANAAEPEGPAATWTIAAVRTWLEARGLAAAAAACAEARVSGAVLLSMNQEDVYSKVQLPGVDDYRHLEEAINELRQRESALPAAAPDATPDVEVLSEAVTRAMTGGEPCPFPLPYLRRCTNGFAESRLVGEGSFGEVFRAVDPVSGIGFVVKRLRLDFAQAQREAAMRSMQRELNVLSTVRHPNMIKLLGHCAAAADGEMCLVYEIGSHGSLADCLGDESKAVLLGWKARVRLITGLASVLNYLHRHTTPPVYHRDVKSANVVLCDGFEPKLIDCGLAKALSQAQLDQQATGRSLFTMGGTSAGALLGTPGYMCPRYLMNPTQYGDSSEVFSFGIVLLETLVGKVTSDFESSIYDYYIEDEEEDLTPESFDRRPGGCPAELAKPLIQLVKDCTLRAYKKRPKMRDVLGRLRRLELTHCALTVEEIQARLTGATAQAQALADVRREEQQKAERAREQAAAARAAAQAAAMRECCSCYDEVNMAAGVECSARPDAHFLCEACFQQCCLTASQEELHVLRDRAGQIFCPMQCGSAYPQPVIAAHVPAPVFEAILHARDRLQEQQLVQQLEQQFEERMAAERRRVQALRADELRVEQTVRHVQERILTLKCPRCEAAFLDFNGCFALTCHRCQCGFCAYCLADCGRDAHQHVQQCPHRLQDGYGGSFAQFEEAQRRRRQRMVQGYLADVGADIRDRVVAALRRDFADLGLQI